MKPLLFAVAALAVLPVASQAQTRNDLDYCQQLAGTYEHYIGRSEKSPYGDTRRGNLKGQVAATQCQTHTADAIRTLEQELRDGRFDLPPRG